MMNAGRDLVDVDDTIVCLGGSGVDGSVDETQAAQWNDAPGQGRVSAEAGCP